MAPRTSRRRTSARTISPQGERLASLIRLFMREHLVFMKGTWAGKPFILEDWQWREIIRPIFGTVDAKGDRLYREAVIGLPRDGGKSEIAAAIALACMFTEPVYEGEYVVVARNRKQAGIVFNKARRMVLRDPVLRAACDVRATEIIVRDTGARFYTVPWDAGSAQGIHATVCVIDEYHVHRNDSMRYAMLSGMIAQENALLITISTAGAERKGPLWELLKSAPTDPRAYVYWAGATDEDDGHDPKVWRKANPQKWITMKMLRDAYRTLPFPEFERYHLNRFPSKGTNRAYPGHLWHACAVRPEIDESRPSILALDASWTRASTALVFDQTSDDGWHNVSAWIWHKNEALGHIDHEEVEAKIVELCADFNIVRIACDVNYFTRSMLRLQDEFGLPVEEFKQSDIKMSQASMTLYDVLQEGRMRHGDNRELGEQVLNAGLKPTPYGWRLTRVETDLLIDAAVALAMATYIAESEAGSFAPSFASTGGIWTLPLG